MKFTLADQLAKKGLVSQEAAARLDGERTRLDGERAAEALNETMGAKGRRSSVMDLRSAKDIQEFSQIAKTILMENFTLINTVVQEAHRYKENKGFIWRMYQVRDRFSRCPPEKREQFLSRAFRRHDPTVEIPE